MLLELDSWCTIFEILRETCIEDVRILKGIGIQVGNPTTYGEITPKFVEQIIHEIGITADDIFYDIGSGIGNVVLQVATQIGCVSHGIEIRPELTDIACRMQNKLIELSKTRYKNSLKVPEIHFHTGDALSEEYDLQDATIIFLNNWCFGGELEHDLFVKFQKLLKEGTKIICLKDAFPRFRPNSLRYDDLPCQRFRYPWRKFLSCEDAISWDSRLVECVIYQIHDYGCSVAQANSLINSLQIFDDPIPALPSARPRQLNVEEAKIMLKRLLSENFVAKDIPLTGRSENDILLLIKEMQNQTFYSSFADSTIIYNQLLGTAKLPKKFPTPQIVEIRETARDKVFPTVHSGWVTCPDDFEKAFERQKIPTKKLRTSNVFLRRNMRNFEEEIPTKPKFLFIQRRPFSRVVEEEDELFIVFPSFIKDPKQKITASARIPPHLRIGTRPSWKPARPKKKPPLILPPPIPPKISFGILKPGLRPNWANIRAKRNTIIVNRPNPFQNYPSNRYSSRLHHSFATLSLRANSSLPFIPTTNTLQLNRDKLKTLNPSITYYQPQFPTKHNSPHSNGKSNSQQKSKKRSKSHMASQEHEAQQPRKKVPAHFHSTSDLHHSSHPGTPSHVRVPSPPPNILRPCAIVPHIHPPLIPPISAPTPIPPRPIASPKKKPIPGSARNPKLVRKNHAGSASYMEDNKANRRSTRIRKKEFKKTLFIPIAPQLQDSKRSITIEPSPPKLRERAVPGESKRSEPLKRAKLGVKNPPVFLRRNIPKNGKIKKPHRRNSQPITHKETTEATRPRNIMSIDFISNAPVSNTEPSTISTSYIDITTDDVIIHECAPIRLLPKTVIPSNIFPTETPTLVSSVVISTPEEPTPEESIPEAPIPEQPLPEQLIPEEPIPEALIPETTAKAKSKAKPKAKSRQTAKVKAAPEAGLVPMSIEKSKSKPKAKKSPPRTTKKKQKKTGHKNGAVKKANVPANGKDSAVVSAANVVLQVSDSPMITAGEAEKSVLQEVDVMHLKEKLLQGEKNIRGMKPSTRQSVRLSRSKRKWRLNL